MSYENVALAAQKDVTKSLNNPITAWEKAAEHEFPNSKWNQIKSCPKGAFLGLCEDGLIKNIPVGKYTVSSDNKLYAITAVRMLKENASFALHKPKDLFIEVLKRLSRDQSKTYNQQMHVVLALWNAGLIK